MGGRREPFRLSQPQSRAWVSSKSLVIAELAKARTAQRQQAPPPAEAPAALPVLAV
jgi:hypothetical protein